MTRTHLLPQGVAGLGLLVIAFGLAVPTPPADAAPQPRIVGGTQTTVSEWPWQAALVFDHTFGGSDFDRQFCGASVIAARFVLTAAHCVTDPVLAPSQLEVVVGRTTLSANDGQRLDVSSITVNPSYNAATIENDAAVVELSAPTTQQPIPLAGPSETGLWAAGNDAWVTGWGSTSPDGSTPQDTLREAVVPMISDAMCNSAYGPEFFPGVMVCAGNLAAGGVDSCAGDSGGPLVVPAPGGEWREVGVASWGIGCAEPGHPGVYSRVGDDPLRSFIQSIVAPHGQPPAPPPPAQPATIAKAKPCSRKTGVKRSRCLCKREATRRIRRKCLKRITKPPATKPPAILAKE